MRPTKEQQAILDFRGRVLLINARAGTGKTTTLRMIAAGHQNLKILYLVYNRKAKEAADGTFPENVNIRTVHSLAFSGDVRRWKDQVGAFTIADMLPAFKERKNAQQLAALSYHFLVFFMNSPFPKVEPAMDAFQAAHLDHGADHVKKSFQDARERIIQASRDILGRWYRQEKTCPHDFYLKLFHREGHLYRVLNGYDMILVDEGQDLSPIMLDALAHCRKRIIVAGDSHQQIYSFRYAIDAMKRFSFDEERDLTMSFRFGRHIADLASLFIREAKGERQFRIKGNPAISSTVSFYGKLPCPKNGERCAVLSRTNLALFEKALTLRSRGIPFSLEGNVAAIFGRILDVYWLSEHERDRIRDPFIRSFANLDALEIYARDLDDFQMAGMLKAVREHTRILPDAVYHMMSVSQNTSGASNGRGMILSTVHGSKGQEYDRVYIDPDVAVSLSRPNGQSGNEFGEEVNIAYVSFTRAIRDLHLAMDFKKILSPEWQAAVNRYETSQNAHPLPGPRIRRVQGGSHGFSHTRSGRLKTEVPQAQTPEEKPFKVGDRVRSGCGTGTIVDADGGKYLVDLDGQSARIWEKAWGLRAV